ncbi:hypothetical protein CEXT_200341 [Caerostris extrusa]|uniref:Uncharacterized protein n=1 Tax=Caerostris extrusa TaxID=172846 RepID=A0AAV4T057_CAEEX|nr:hypothetical protein CEXT_200341 [Caerostris extrusa]
MPFCSSLIYYAVLRSRRREDGLMVKKMELSLDPPEMNRGAKRAFDSVDGVGIFVLQERPKYTQNEDQILPYRLKATLIERSLNASGPWTSYVGPFSTIALDAVPP